MSPETMEIQMTIRLVGLSMQASLRKLQECSEQLLAAFSEAGIDPASFELCDLNARALEEEQKQCASLVLQARAAADPGFLYKVWQVIAQMPFGVELDVSFLWPYLPKERQKMQMEALHLARENARAIAADFDQKTVRLSSVRFEWKEAEPTDGLTIKQTIDQKDEPGLGKLKNLQPPLRQWEVEACSCWQMQ